ncbi:MAG: hypothetical protein JW889_15475 [Verrucomicrobia bacterium]|nr:hypothetical protein [Verrucomicrobiota bacterium]
MTNLTNVVLLWLVSAVVTAIAAWAVFDLAKVKPTDRNLLFFVGGVVAYAVVGYFLQPAADEEGSNWLYNGPSYSGRRADEQGENNLALAIALFPGRVIGLAIVHTFRFIRQAAAGRGGGGDVGGSGNGQMGSRFGL